MRKLTYEFIISKFEKEGYKVLTKKENYKNTKTRLKVICPDGEYWETNYNKFSNGVRKPCKPLKYEYVKEYIENEGYKLLSNKYINNRTKLLIECPYCGNKFRVHFNNFKDSGSRCPSCQNNFKGEEKIAKFLKENDIEFIRGYRFKDCKFKRQLPFDFYLPKYKLLIEYDGIQHFEYKHHFGGIDGFVDRKIRDTIKNIYCKENNIKLIRIPYWEFDNIENILINKLNLNHE